MASNRSDFVSSFLLNELLSALDPRVCARDMDLSSSTNGSESLSEETESSSALQTARPTAQSRVMLVRRTNSSQQLVTLVDREFDIQAFIPIHLIHWLQQERGYETIGRLRGSVVRVTKYHFATWTRCLASDKQTTISSSMSVSALARTRDRDPVYLYVDALAIVDDTELAVKPLPWVYTYPLVVEQLQKLNDAELEKQLMIHQGLPPLQVDGGFTDDRPLLEEDCVIPAEQELELEERDEWGSPVTIVRPPTDSELIAENGPVPMSESQVMRQSENSLSTQESKAMSTDVSVALEHKEENNDRELDAVPPLDEQRYLFQQENIRETFVVDSDSESYETAGENEVVTQKTSIMSEHPDSSRKHSVALSDPSLTTSETTQDSWALLDLTDDSPEKARITSLSLEEKTVPEQESTTEACDVLAEADEYASSDPSSQSPLAKNDNLTGKRKASAGWATSLLRMVGLNTSSAKASPSTVSSSDAEIEDLIECEQSDAESLDRTEEETVEFKPAQPEDPLLSQATVILPYATDNEDDAHAFEYEGLLSDDVVSPKAVTPSKKLALVTGRDPTNERCVTEKEAEAADTPQEGLVSKKDTATADPELPSRSVQAVTPMTAIQPEPAIPLLPTVLPCLEETLDHQDRSTSCYASPSCSSERVRITFSAAQLVPVKGPIQQDVAVESSLTGESHAGAAAITSHGCKRRQQMECCSTQKEPPMPQPQRMQTADEFSYRMQKRRRRNALLTRRHHESESPQFELPAAHVVTGRADDNYSLDAVGKALGSRARIPNTGEEQTCTSAQPRRAWKRYEKLFPPLNMTRLKQLMAANIDNCEK
uniref:Uncharacterized protein n=1 Tax=Hyaloperonospora arabidopsidis (strain Emoy2) TaxID=559515 RepID=M4BBX5_HYAAE